MKNPENNHKKVIILEWWEDNSIRQKNQEIKLFLDSNKMTQKMMLDSAEKGEVYEQSTFRLIRRYLQKGDVFVDIGAHIGYYSVIAARIVGSAGKVFAFEPEIENYKKILEHNSSCYL